MKKYKENWEYYLALSIGVVCIVLSILRAYENRIEIQPEVIDRYPKYFAAYDQYGLISGGIKMAFDACNGEACVPDAITANLCPNPNLCVSRTRNFNYFTDYLDAIFFKEVTTKLGMVSNVIGSILVFVFTFFGLRAYRKEMSSLRLVILSSSVLFLSQILSMENILYRSGKILTVVYISWLFYLFYKTKERNKGFGVFGNIAIVIASCALLLSDEMAVFVTSMCFLFVFYRQLQARYFIENSNPQTLIYRNATIFTGGLLLFYVIFRVLLEPFISDILNGISIERGVQTYSNFSNFLVLDFKTFQASINAIFFNIVDSVSPANNFASQPWFWSGALIISAGITHSVFRIQWRNFSYRPNKLKIACLILFVTILLIGANFSLRNYDVPNTSVIASILFLLGTFGIYLFIQSDNFFNESFLLFLLWVSCLYLMGLRHSFIFSPAGFKATYYFLPTIYLFFLWVAIGLTKNNLLSTFTGTFILTGMIFFNIGNFLYASNTARFFPENATSLILQSAEHKRPIALDSTAQVQNFYKLHGKFLQGLTSSGTSCFYKECALRKTSNYLLDKVDVNQKSIHTPFRY